MAGFALHNIRVCCCSNSQLFKSHLCWSLVCTFNFQEPHSLQNLLGHQLQSESGSLENVTQYLWSLSTASLVPAGSFSWLWCWPCLLGSVLLVPQVAQCLSKQVSCSTFQLLQCTLTHQLWERVPEPMLASLAAERNYPLLFKNVNKCKQIGSCWNSWRCLKCTGVPLWETNPIQQASVKSSFSIT